MRISEQKKATASAGYVCRLCKEPVGAVVKRHKTMGVFVPVWTPEPCRNPLCRGYVPEQEPSNRAGRDTGFQPRARRDD